MKSLYKCNTKHACSSVRRFTTASKYTDPNVFKIRVKQSFIIPAAYEVELENVNDRCRQN